MKSLVFFFFLAFCFSQGRATVLNVPAEYNSIQASINAAAQGDTVLVQPGRYKERINFSGKNIVVASLFLTTGDTSYIAQTIIDGNKSGVVAMFRGREDSTAVLAGFTLTNGTEKGVPENECDKGPKVCAGGGGIVCSNSGPTLRSLIITDNHDLDVLHYTAMGGGIFLENSNLRIEHTQITNNSAETGGGIFCASSTLRLVDVSISGNSTVEEGNGAVLWGHHGGGIVCSGSTLVLKDVRIENNNGGECGGGIFSTGSSLILDNVRICDNHAIESGGGMWFNALYMPMFNIKCGDSSSAMIVRNVTIADNSAQSGGGLSFCTKNPDFFNETTGLNIYYNRASEGADIYYLGDVRIIVPVDTLTTNNPTDFFVSPLDMFDLKVSSGKVNQMKFDLYVSPAGDNDNIGNLSDSPLKSIAKAFMKISADSLSPTKIHLLPGIYGPATNGESFPLFLPDLVCLSGESECGVIIDALHQNSVFIIKQAKQVRLESMTIRRGMTKSMDLAGGITSIRSDVIFKNITISQNVGGGIVSNVSRVTLDNVTFTENTSYEGAGVCIRGDESAPGHSETIIENVKIVDNSSEYGGGISVASSKLSLKNAQIRGNSARAGGGLILAGSDALLQNVLIANNRANEGGGGIQNEGSDLRLINVTLSGNTGGSSGVGIRDLSTHSSIDLVNSIVWNNSPSEIYFSDASSVTVAHSDIYGERDYIRGKNLELNWLDHNLNLDPYFTDPLNGDYRLQFGSPCIDAGVQDTFFVYTDGQDTLFIPLIGYFGAAPDIGAFEYDPLDIKADDNADVPDRYELSQNYPNPFNETTVIEFSLPKDERVKIILFNLLGQSAAAIVDQKLSAGWHNIRIPAENLSSGVYLYEMRTDTFVGRKKMIVIR